MPTEVVKTVGTAGDYTTWALWEADTDNDLVTADQVQVGNQVNESLTTPSITMVGATTDATRYREMRGQGFDGLGGGAVLNMTTGILTISEANFRCTTLNIAHSGSGTMAISITTSAGILVDRCIIYDANATTGRTYQILIDSSASATIRRCVIIGWNRGVLINTGTTGVIQNCTAIGRAPTVAVGTPWRPRHLGGLDRDPIQRIGRRNEHRNGRTCRADRDHDALPQPRAVRLLVSVQLDFGRIWCRFVSTVHDRYHRSNDHVMAYWCSSTRACTNFRWKIGRAH